MKPTETLIGHLESNIFPFSVVVAIGDFNGKAVFEKLNALYRGSSPVTLDECVEKEREINNHSSAYGHHWCISPVTSVLWICNPSEVDGIAHETFHAVYWLLSNQGIQLTPETNEVYAYMMGWIVKGIRDGVMEYWKNNP